MPSHGPHPRRPQNELQETPQAMPPLYREAELEMNFPSSAAGRVDGTCDEAGRPPTSTSAQMDELQETSRALPVNRSTFAQSDATELEMTLMNGSESVVATDATNQPQVAWHQSNKARRYMYIVGVGVLVLIGLCLVTNAYLLIRQTHTRAELHSTQTELHSTQTELRATQNELFSQLQYCAWHENPCLHSGACQSKDRDSYTCACVEGWGGDDCGDEVPYCDWHENPCLHSGECQSKDRVNFSCKCANGYTGTTCDTNWLACCKGAIHIAERALATTPCAAVHCFCRFDC